MVDAGTDGKSFVYEFRVGMTCDGCSNAIKKILSTQPYVQNLEISVPDKQVKIVGPDGIESVVMERLTKWANAA